MKTLVIYRMVSTGLWFYADPILNKLMLNHVCSKLAPLRTAIELWLADNPGNRAAVEHDNEQLALMNDADWAVALLKFGP